MATMEEALRDLQLRLMAMREAVFCLASAVAQQPGIDATKLRADVLLALDELPDRRKTPLAQEICDKIAQAIELGSVRANPPPAGGTPPQA